MAKDKKNRYKEFKSEVVDASIVEEIATNNHIEIIEPVIEEIAEMQIIEVETVPEIETTPVEVVESKQVAVPTPKKANRGRIIY